MHMAQLDDESPAIGPPRLVPAPQLTLTDLQLLALMAGGATNASIARTLQVTERTVERRAADVQDKLGAETRIHVVVKALRLGLL